MNSNLNYSSLIHELSSFGKGQGNGQGAINHTTIKSFLRHDHPILGVDQILDHNFQTGWAHALRGISCSQPVFQGHFKDSAVYPGTTLCQDVIQVAILLFIGMTGPLKTEKPNSETTVVSDLHASFGHPIPPGSLLDIAIWCIDSRNKKALKFQFEVRSRFFPYYDKPNRFGITFKPPLSGTCSIIRVKRKIYDGIPL